MHWRNNAWQARRSRVCRTRASRVTPIAAEKQTIKTTYKHTPPFWFGNVDYETVADS
jgi:hypothetical protein